ncbi:indolepyruvate ferredoxin oxidoreductase subunit alpha [Desulfurococcus amylolyticus]|uniref:indolepyruvate ferredoxin oxidoreductase subunit alpha n=1 Tax=Desulfurococcus TaxID=2273 RepID=UPI0005B1E412|nr:indolepyruvate ferredoxin oxidoreductase subunit alpha [Desulfurococcus amylolyticus]
MSYILSGKGEKVLLMGNEAIARAALEAGICVATAYPGTPSTEIIETLSEVAGKCGIYVEWSINEKVAFETAYAAAITGVRSITAMKHVGVNVAADILMSSAYSGVKEGFVVVSADDPGEHSSQNEQDNRWYGLLAHIPVIEPSSARDSYYLTKEAFELSSRYEHPVILRTTTRVSHTRQPVELNGDIPSEKKCKGVFDKNYERWVLVPANARKQKTRMMKIWEAIRRNEGREPFIYVWNPGRSKVVIASGISYSHAEEALRLLDALNDVTLIKVSLPVPLPPAPITTVLKDAKEVLVIEELDPVVETQVKDIAVDEGLSVKIHGKNMIPENGELSIDRVFEPVAKFIGRETLPPWQSIGEVKTEPPIPPRPPVLCAGCPHRSTYYIVKTALNKAGIRNTVFTGDIGCYTLGYQKPFETQMTCFEMGGSLGIAHGFGKVLENTVIAVIGDSTFFHAGIPPVLNIVYNDSKVIPLILDNSTTAMTGHQPHPGTGITAMGLRTTAILPEKILEQAGFKTIVINPLRVKESIELLTQAFKEYLKGERIAIVSRMRCALEVARDARRKQVVLPIYTIVEDKCIGCMACVNLTACPAIIVPAGSKKPIILEELCNGCGLCASICPYKAITVKNTPSPEWEKLW